MPKPSHHAQCIDKCTLAPSSVFADTVPCCTPQQACGKLCCCVLTCRDCDEYKRWKASQDAAASGVEGAVADLTLKDKDGAEIEKQLPGGKVKKKAKPQV